MDNENNFWSQIKAIVNEVMDARIMEIEAHSRYMKERDEAQKQISRGLAKIDVLAASIIAVRKERVTK